eukprot:scaffold54820_cov36-Phaeocystis_antarctica.AAC.1
MDLLGEAVDACLDGRIDVRVARLLYRVDDLLTQLGVIGTLGLRPENPAITQPVVAHKVVRLKVLVVDAHDGVDNLRDKWLQAGCKGLQAGCMGLQVRDCGDHLLQKGLKGAVDEEDHL